MKKLLKNLAQRFGYDILHLPTDPVSRQWLELMHGYQIDLIFDAGANTGQFGQRVRKLGYAQDIISFEPIAETYRQLQVTAAADSQWKTVYSALGDYDGTAEINVSTNS